jgi:hypothetical protein
MRKLIAGMQISVDGKIEGPEGYADWVEAWSDSYDLTPQVDACLLGANMYPGYEEYWTAIQNEPDKPLPTTGKVPTPGEVEYARFAAQTPHYVLSSTLTSALWPRTSFVDSKKLQPLNSNPARTSISLVALEPPRALSMPGWWMNSGSLFIRSWPVKARRSLRRRNVAAGLSYGSFSSCKAGV